jgi:HlyD family secretion protein
MKTMTTEAIDIKEKLGLAPGRKRWMRLLRWFVFLAIVAWAVSYWMNKQKAAAAQPVVHYRTETARAGNLTVTVTATGQVKPTRAVDVGSEVSGLIDEVLVNYNDTVTAGQILAKINTEKLDAQVLQDQAQLRSALAKVEDAKVTVTETEAEYRRIVDARERSKGQLVSQHDVDASSASRDRAKVAVTSAQASVTQSEANLKIDQTNLAKAVIKSPVSGIVLARNVEPGQTIAASFSVTTMFQIAEDLSKMKLEVNIDEADVGEVKEGQRVAFTVDAYPGRQFPGRITQVRFNSSTTNNVVTYLAVISVDNAQLLLRPGMTATAAITVLSLDKALLGSNHALRFVPSDTGTAQGGVFSFMMPPREGKKTTESTAALNNPRVWVLRDGKPAAVPVVLGATDGKFTAIKSGDIAPGAELIVETLRDSR